MKDPFVVRVPMPGEPLGQQHGQIGFRKRSYVGNYRTKDCTPKTPKTAADFLKLEAASKRRYERSARRWVEQAITAERLRK